MLHGTTIIPAVFTEPLEVGESKSCSENVRVASSSNLREIFVLLLDDVLRFVAYQKKRLVSTTFQFFKQTSCIDGSTRPGHRDNEQHEENHPAKLSVLLRIAFAIWLDSDLKDIDGFLCAGKRKGGGRAGLVLFPAWRHTARHATWHTARGLPEALMPFEETTSSIRRIMQAASVAERMTCSFVRRGSTTFCLSMSSTLPVTASTPIHVFSGFSCFDSQVDHDIDRV